MAYDWGSTSGCVAADGPYVVGSDPGHIRERDIWEHERGGLGPLRAVPVQRQRAWGTIVVIPNSPDVIGGDSGDAGEIGVVVGVGAGHNAPLRAIPMLDEGAGPAATAVSTDSPYIVGRDCCYRSEV